MLVLLQGEEHKLKKFLNKERLYMKKNGITSEFDVEIEPETGNNNQLKVKDIVDIIEKATTEEEIEQFKDDTRKGVIKAYTEKSEELKQVSENDNNDLELGSDEPEENSEL